MLVKKLRHSLYSFLVLALCVGCSNDSVSTKVTRGAEADRHQNSMPEPRAEVEIRKDDSRGKPGAQISLADNQVYHLDPGVEAGINIALIAPYSEGEMRVAVKTSDGLLILNGASNYLFTLRADKEYALPLQLFAPDAGRYYVNLHITVIQEGRETFKAISAIVQAGSPNDRINPSVQSEKAAKSDGVISLPAKEVIIRE